MRRGDRIAQLVVQPVARVEFEERDSLPDSPRGETGHGASGGFGTPRADPAAGPRARPPPTHPPRTDHTVAIFRRRKHETPRRGPGRRRRGQQDLAEGDAPDAEDTDAGNPRTWWTRPRTKSRPPRRRTSRSPAPAARTTFSEVDERADEEAGGDVERLDLGSLRFRPVDGMQLRLELDETPADGPVRAHCIVGDSSVQVQAFAAPRTMPVWPEIPRRDRRERHRRRRHRRRAHR